MNDFAHRINVSTEYPLGHLLIYDHDRCRLGVIESRHEPPILHLALKHIQVFGSHPHDPAGGHTLSFVDRSRIGLHLRGQAICRRSQPAERFHVGLFELRLALGLHPPPPFNDADYLPLWPTILHSTTVHVWPHHPTGPHLNGPAGHVLELLRGETLHTIAQGDDHDHGRHADDDAQYSQCRAHLARLQAQEAEPDIDDAYHQYIPPGYMPLG